MVESKDLDEERMNEYKSRYICESKPLVGKHTAIRFERSVVAIGYYPGPRNTERPTLHTRSLWT